MKTLQPSWKLLYSTDCERVLVDETGVYSPEMEVAQEIFDSSDSIQCPECCGTGKSPEIQSIDDENEPEDCNECYGEGTIETGNVFEVFRFSLERYRMWTFHSMEYMVPFGYDQDTYMHSIDAYQPWFYYKLDYVAASAGTTKSELVRCLCSENPKDLAFAYSCIGGHFGFNNFDGYPLTLTEKELNDRWDK